MRTPLIFLSAFCLLNVLSSSAQDSLQNEKPKPYFKASIEYLNNSVYLGRKDSVAIPYLTPELSYHFKSGVYLNASLSYLPDESRIDVSTLGGGYAFSKKKWDGEITAEKYFYNSQSYNVNAESKGEVSGSIGYDLGFAEPQLSGFVNFADKNDYGSSFSLAHYFSLFHDHANLGPTFVINASTQNSYALYYQKRKYAKNRKGKKVNYTITANTVNTSQFKILDYEFSTPLEYEVKRFDFSFTPTVAVPVNPSTVILSVKSSNGPSTSRMFTENLSTSFFWSVSIAYKIKGK